MDIEVEMLPLYLYPKGAHVRLLRSGCWCRIVLGDHAARLELGLLPSALHDPDRYTQHAAVACLAEAFAGEALPGTRVRASKRLSASDLEKFKLGKLKQVCKYLFAANPGLTPYLAEVLSADAETVTADATLERIERLVEAHWRAPEDVLVDAFSMRAGYERGMRDGGKAVQSTFVAAKSRTEEE